MKRDRSVGQASSARRVRAACNVSLLLLPVLIGSPAAAVDTRSPDRPSPQSAPVPAPTAVRDAIVALQAACKAWSLPNSATVTSRAAPSSGDELTCRAIMSHGLAFVPEPQPVAEAIAAARAACASWQPSRVEPGDVYVSREPGPDALVCSMAEDPDGAYLHGMLSLAALAMAVLALATGVAMMVWWFIRTVRSRRQEAGPVSRSAHRLSLVDPHDVA